MDREPQCLRAKGACISIRVYTGEMVSVFCMVVGLGQPVRVLAKERDQGERFGDVTVMVEDDCSQVWGRGW